MKKYLVLGILFGLFLNFGVAQNDMDAFRFSQSDWGGTARFMGAGGAFGAVGAEFSALNTNPASIGLYKKMEITFTPLVVSIFNTTSNYNGTMSKYLATNYSLTNAGFVLAFDRLNKNWNTFQMAFGYNRVYDFNGEYRTDGNSNGSTMMDVFVDRANASKDWDEDTWEMWDAYLIDYDSTAGHYYSPLSKMPLNQSCLVKTSGAIDEMVFTFGGNYQDKLFLGATIGVPFLHYTEKVTYSEVDALDSISGFKSFDIDDRLRVRGAGINFKLGILYQPADFVRFGFAFHTPTFYEELKDNYSRTLNADLDRGKYNSEIDNYYKYCLTTPLRAMANVAFFIKKRAFISAEYEYTNYALSTLYSQDYAFNAENEAMKEKYGSQHILRVGGEIRLTDIFSLRAGYNYKSNPYRDGINDGSAHIASAGIGFRGRTFSVDLAYQLKIAKEKYWFYDPSYVNAAENSFMYHRIAATFGFKF